MVECGRHLNIEILTLSEVVGVSGEKGNFSVSVKKHPRYIDMEKCIACGLCAQKCPKKVPDQFNQEISKRKAAYIQYGQTVPLKYLIDEEHCLYLTKGKCRACEKFCPTGAINFEDKEEIVNLNVGSVILAPGFKPFDPKPFENLGYGTIPDVVTSLEYERLLSASGPCMGHLVRPSDNREPKKIAWLQCVGSRNTNRCSNGYCSSVCCMYAIKQSLVTAEHLSGDSVEQTLFYMDIRTHGKEFERYYEGAKAKGVRFVRSIPHTIMPGKDNNGVILNYTTDQGRQVYEDFDMLVLSVGLEAPEDAVQLADVFGFELDRYHFAKTTSFDSVASSRDGVFVTGAFQSPKAIPRSVTEASAAAAAAAKALAEVKGSLTHAKSYPVESDVAGEAPRIGVFVCSCGINIANVVDVQSVVDFARTLPDVVFVENNLFTCSTDTQSLIAEKIKEHRLNRIVVAACTPRTHEALFQDTLKEAGLNPYLFEMANIRNHNAWVHQDNPEAATAKAMDQVRMAVAKVAMNHPLQNLSIPVVQQALVVGGGLAGITAALGLADQGYQTILIEKNSRLGGNAWRLNKTWKGEVITDIVQRLIDQVQTHSGIEVLTDAALVSAAGSVGSFESRIEVGGQTRTIKYGAAVIATGASEYTPTEYLYGQDDRILTHLQFDHLLTQNPATLEKTDSVVFIQCVGSRQPDRPYCSRVCCTHSVSSAIALKEINPRMNVYILNRDIRTYGEREQLYEKARRLGVIFIRYETDDKPDVAVKDGDLTVTAFDPILQQRVAIDADYLVLASAIVPHVDPKLVDIYKLGINEDGFINEAHPKLRPVETSVDGLFLAGMCNYPKPVEESLVQARAAVSRASVILAKKEMQLDAIKSYVTDQCDGCALCIDVCPYRAISLVSEQRDGREIRRVETDKALCKGCGLCEATCPKGGISVHGFTTEQLKQQVHAALGRIDEAEEAKRSIAN